MEYGDIPNDEFLKMKHFTKDAFTWFITLLPNSILNWRAIRNRFSSIILYKRIESECHWFHQIGQREFIDDVLNETNYSGINLPKLKLEPYFTCHNFKPPESRNFSNAARKTYAFDISNQIFIILLKDHQIYC